MPRHRRGRKRFTDDNYSQNWGRARSYRGHNNYRQNRRGNFKGDETNSEYSSPSSSEQNINSSENSSCSNELGILLYHLVSPQAQDTNYFNIGLYTCTLLYIIGPCHKNKLFYIQKSIILYL